MRVVPGGNVNDSYRLGTLLGEGAFSKVSSNTMKESYSILAIGVSCRVSGGARRLGCGQGDRQGGAVQGGGQDVPGGQGDRDYEPAGSSAHHKTVRGVRERNRGMQVLAQVLNSHHGKISGVPGDGAGQRWRAV